MVIIIIFLSLSLESFPNASLLRDKGGKNNHFIFCSVIYCEKWFNIVNPNPQRDLKKGEYFLAVFYRWLVHCIYPSVLWGLHGGPNKRKELTPTMREESLSWSLMCLDFFIGRTDRIISVILPLFMLLIVKPIIC